MKRRDFLWLLGVISGSAAMSSCGSPKRWAKSPSYLRPPEEGVVPGEASFHPATGTEGPAGCGVVARVREGRPVKLEGIPGHPVNDGGLCVRGQSSLYRLYHPERIRGPMAREGGKLRPIPWEEAFARVAGALRASREKGRKNLFLSGRTTGSLSRLADAACERLEVERLPEYEVYSHAAVKEANGLLFGEREIPHYRIEKADFLLTVGADLLETYVTPVAYTRKLSSARAGGDFLWHHVEPHMSLTGADADRRFTVAPGRGPPPPSLPPRGAAGGVGGRRRRRPDPVGRGRHPGTGRFRGGRELPERRHAPGHGETLRPDGEGGSGGRVPLPHQSRLLPAATRRLPGEHEKGRPPGRDGRVPRRDRARGRRGPTALPLPRVVGRRRAQERRRVPPPAGAPAPAPHLVRRGRAPRAPREGIGIGRRLQEPSRRGMGEAAGGSREEPAPREGVRRGDVAFEAGFPRREGGNRSPPEHGAGFGRREARPGPCPLHQDLRRAAREPP